MESPAQRPFITVEEYLEGEPASTVRHEYIGGAVYAMAGGSKEHNQICGNFYLALDRHFGDANACRVFFNDLKVRLLISGEDIFYYPDVAVACDPRDTDSHSLRFPRLIVEVLSPTTEQTDRREKLLAYRTIPTLEEYVIVAQDRIEVTLFRRAEGWQSATFTQLDQTVRLASVDLELPVAAIYRRIFA